MTPFNSKNRLDNSSGIGQDNSNEAMNATEQSKKMPWHLRFAGAGKLKEIAATAGIGALYGLLFAGLLFAPLLPHLAAQSSGTPTRTTSTAQLQDGAQVQWIWMLPIAGGIGVRIAWRKWLIGTGGALAVGVGGNAIWDAATKTWTLPPGATRKGRVTARARIGLWKVDGETTHWYSKSGSWAWQRQSGFNRNDPDDELNTDPDVSYPSSDDQKRDYHYFDLHTWWLYWDEDNEIWKSNGESGHHYGDSYYYPNIFNAAYNQGDPGQKYPGHEDYYKGKEGYFIYYGYAGKNYLSHEFYSAVHRGKDEDLAAEAKLDKYKKDKFNPYCLVTVSDMTYTANGWKYERRAPSERHRVTRELSAVENDAETLNAKEYIPQNTRHEKTVYFYNNCIVYWKTETRWKTENVQPEGSDTIFENQPIPYPVYVPEQQITHYNW